MGNWFNQNDYEYLLDKKFLKELDKYNNKEEFVRIRVLDSNEDSLKDKDGKPITIEGVATGGNLNITSNSAVRRNGTISLIVDNIEDEIISYSKITEINNLLSIKTKIVIEVGIRNELFWFNKYYGKENFSIIWFPLGVYVIKNPSISKSLTGLNISLTVTDKMSLLNGELGGVFPASVVFSKIENKSGDGESVYEYTRVFTIIQTLIHQYGGEKLENIYINDVDNYTKKVVKWSQPTPAYLYNIGDAAFIDTSYPDSVKAPEATYNNGDVIGFVEQEFIWPGNDLVANIGDTITSVLDKIKNALGNYEYFYDIYGNFIWQEKKDYSISAGSGAVINNFFGNINKEQILSNYSGGKSQYTFDNNELITSLSSSPQYGNIKNDFIVWGKRKVGDTEKAIRYRLVCDKEPEISESPKTYVCLKMEIGANLFGYKPIDPLPIDETSNVVKAGEINKYYYTEDKKTVYLFTQDKQYVSVKNSCVNIVPTKWQTEVYLKGMAQTNQIYADNPIFKDLEYEWPNLYDMEANEGKGNYKVDVNDIDYYIHFIDMSSNGSDEANNINCSNIGYKTKTLNDASINCIYSNAVPDNILIKAGTEINNPGTEYRYIQVKEDIYNNLSSYSLNSAFESARQLFNEYSNYKESITLNTIPIYYLEPNERITVNDEDTGISGDYVVNSISLPLTINGTMTIAATKAVEIS